MAHTCLVCKFPDLKSPPRSPSGGGSYEICPACGYQYGVDDDDLNITPAQWRKQWVAAGAKWSSKGIAKPPGWSYKAPAKKSTPAKKAAPAKKTATKKKAK